VFVLQRPVYLRPELQEGLGVAGDGDGLLEQQALDGPYVEAGRLRGLRFASFHGGIVLAVGRMATG
jgi:hypothetical protein